MRTTYFGLVIAVGMSGLVACQGAIDTSGGDGTGANGGDGSGNNTGGDGSGATGGGGVTHPAENVKFECKDPTAVEMGPTPMRRLSHVEYNNTIEALLGDTSQPASRFDADPPMFGYDNNVESLLVPTKVVEDYFTAAEQIAYRASNNLARLMPCTTQDEACALQFVDKVGLKAYRRPLDAEENKLLADLYRGARAAGDDFQTAIRVVLTAMLQSPQFLFRAEVGSGEMVGKLEKLTDYEVASRLSYTLWGSMPDDTLFAAAAAGQLRTPDQVLAQAGRMLTDPRAKKGLVRFTEQWIPATSIHGEHPNMMKDTTIFRDWQPGYPLQMYTEVSRFIDHVTWTDGGRLETFLTAPYTFMNDALARYYRIPTSQVPNMMPNFVKVDLDPARQPGFLTRGGIMSLMARPNDTRPVGRGVFIREHLLCKTVPPPNPDPAVDEARKVIEMPSGNLTQKERLGMIIQDAGCKSCHALFNPLGLAMENFDGAGKFRTQLVSGQAIDPSGEFVGVSDALDGPFTNHVDMINKIAGSAEAKECFVKNVFRFTAGRAESDVDGCTLRAIDDLGAASGYDVRQLLLGTVTAEGFLYRSDG